MGMVGLGVMGRNMVLNMADHGFSVVGFDLKKEQQQALLSEGAGKPVAVAENLPQFVAMLEKPRVVVLLVPAWVVDPVLKDQLAHLEAGDMIIDGGNSYFKDTDRRATLCAEKGIHFFGMGVSGGEEGARHGPSMMPGGPKESYERMRPVLEAIAAKVNGEPCVTWVGNGSAGHYVKMVHNGIEYGIMQLIAETYDILRQGVGASNQEIHDLFEGWNKRGLNSFLIELVSKVFLKKDDKGGAGELLDKVRDVARSKGTGKWTSQDAFDLQVPVPTIDMAVMSRDLSAMADERKAIATALGTPVAMYAGDRAAFLTQLEHALEAAVILSYAQGMDQIRRASIAYKYEVNLAEVAKIWRGGCIIRSTFLETMRAAYAANPNLPSLLVDAKVAERMKAIHGSLRQVVRTSIEMGLSTPCLMASLAYLDALRASKLPMNLIQSMRDFFGAHTYERTDCEGVFHSHWDKN
jgi:6-phosphogluconate dehydrogenase